MTKRTISRAQTYDATYDAVCSERMYRQDSLMCACRTSNTLSDDDCEQPGHRWKPEKFVGTHKGDIIQR